jgi:hypothetical protein
MWFPCVWSVIALTRFRLYGILTLAKKISRQFFFGISQKSEILAGKIYFAKVISFES